MFLLKAAREADSHELLPKMLVREVMGRGGLKHNTSSSMHKSPQGFGSATFFQSITILIYQMCLTGMFGYYIALVKLSAILSQGCHSKIVRQHNSPLIRQTRTGLMGRFHSNGAFEVASRYRGLKASPIFDGNEPLL